MNKKGSVVARVIDWIGIIGIVLTVITLALVIIQTRYAIKERRNIRGGDELIAVFSPSSVQYFNGTMEPDKGYLYYGWAQVKGNKKCKYTLSYKKATAKKYQTLSAGKFFAKNNVFHGLNYISYANGYTDYNIRVQKTAGLNTKSQVNIDWIVLTKKQ